MKTDRLIKDETMTLAIKKGFDVEICRCGGFPDCICGELKSTQSFLQKWLREVYNIQVYVYSHTVNGKGIYKDYIAHVTGEGNSLDINDPRDEEFQTYEDALEVALQYALELI